MNYINPKSTVACILVKNYKILLAKRVKNPFKNYWCLPGGHVKLFEKIENAIKREIKEELNIKIKPKLFTFDQEVYKNLKWHANVFFFVSKLNVRNTEQYDGLDELINSIQKFGLIHPVIVMENDGKYEGSIIPFVRQPTVILKRCR